MDAEQNSKDGGYRLTLNLTKDEYDKLTHMGAYHDRPRSWIARRAIREMFERQFPDANA